MSDLRLTYSPVIIAIASINVLDLVGVISLPVPVRIILFALNTWMLLHIVAQRRNGRR